MNRRTNRLRAAGAGFGLLLLVATGASAQAPGGGVVRDGTIGPAGGVVPPGEYAPGIDVTYLIDANLGEVSGSNLFHSFAQFSIGADESAGFTAGPAANIIARVPGPGGGVPAPSDILGNLYSEATLFLLNPHGVFFGEEARVDVNGSFHVSTADQLNFVGDENPFLTGQTADPGPLNAMPPASFGFLVDDPKPIVLDGVHLCGGTGESCGPDGQVLSFVGGTITVGGDGTRVDALRAPGGSVQFVSVAKIGVDGEGNQQVDVPLDASNFDVDAQPPGSTFGTVRFENRARVSANSGDDIGTGKIVIRGGTFVMESAELEVTNKGDIDGAADAVDVMVTELIEIGTDAPREFALVASSSEAGGRSGDIRLNGPSVTLKNNASIGTTTSGTADGANVHVDADTIKITETSLFGQISMRAAGADGGSTGIAYLSGRDSSRTDDAAQSIEITNGGQVLTSSDSAATITPTEARIQITSDELTVDDGVIASIATKTGDGGAIDIYATDKVSVVNDGQITTTTESGATAESASRRGGSITIRGGLLEIDDGDTPNEFVAQVATITRAEGKDGTDEGRGGDLTVDVDRVEISRGGQLRSNTEGSAAGGNMHLTANAVIIDGYDASGDFPSGIFATTGVDETTPYAQTGAGGSITIDAQDLTIENGGEIQTNSLGQRLDAGAAGAITIQNANADDGMSERVIVRGEPGVSGDGSKGSKIASQGNNGGDGGSVTIQAHAVEFTDGGEASSSTNAEGNSGDVLVIADSLLISGRNGNTVSGIFAQTNGGQLGDAQDPSNPGSGDAGSIRLTVRDSTVVTDEGLVSVLTNGGGSAGDILFDGEGTIEVSDGGEINASSRQFLRNPSATSDIVVRNAESLLVTRNGKITAEAPTMIGNAYGGNIDVEATNIEVSDGGIITARSVVEGPNAGPAGAISLAAGEDLTIRNGEVSTAVRDGMLRFVAQDGVITIAADEADGAAAAEDLEGGTIHLSAGNDIDISQDSVIRASSDGAGDAGDILVWGAKNLSLDSGSTMTAETTGTGRGGQIVIEKVGDISIGGGSSITTKSSKGAGDAGSIAIAAIDTFQMDSKSEITTTADDAGGGRISIQAGKLVSLYDSTLETTVGGTESDSGDAGDIDITYRGDEPGMTEPQVPEFVVINRSTVRANADADDAGNISIAGQQVLISSDSLIEAKSNRGISGDIRITSPDTDVVSQVTPLTTAFVDPSDRLLPPCIARTERTGSFIVQNRPATPPSPDSPLAAGLGTADGADGASPSDSVECSVFEEKI